VLQKERINRRRVSSISEVSVADEESKQWSNSRFSNESEVMRQIEEDKRQ
jgi:hypothetical protein